MIEGDTIVVQQAIAAARGALEEGTLTLGVFDNLIGHLLSGQKRQRLLYLHTAVPNIYAQAVAAALHEPVQGQRTQIDPTAPDLPYQNVFQALCEGWRVIHFPDQRAPFDDVEIDIVGYEYVLEKWEVIDAH